ncbi:basic proline-rich protein-like [Poecile atricapillus]|uniref:basic proline-rich protein-like n=1 Tax=Poecile atricapillus TaxID=48891 RepID=UPI00273A55DC|nr:basic proline-rich protein-like [Poecile atricapillus]
MGTDVRTRQSPGRFPPGTRHPALTQPCPRTPCPVLRVGPCTDLHPGVGSHMDPRSGTGTPHDPLGCPSGQPPGGALPALRPPPGQPRRDPGVRTPPPETSSPRPPPAPPTVSEEGCHDPGPPNPLFQPPRGNPHGLGGRGGVRSRPGVAGARVGSRTPRGGHGIPGGATRDPRRGHTGSPAGRGSRGGATGWTAASDSAVSFLPRLAPGPAAPAPPAALASARCSGLCPTDNARHRASAPAPLRPLPPALPRSAPGRAAGPGTRGVLRSLAARAPGPAQRIPVPAEPRTEPTLQQSTAGWSASLPTNPGALQGPRPAACAWDPAHREPRVWSSLWSPNTPQHPRLLPMEPKHPTAPPPAPCGAQTPHSTPACSLWSPNTPQHPRLLPMEPKHPTAPPTAPYGAHTSPAMAQDWARTSCTESPGRLCAEPAHPTPSPHGVRDPSRSLQGSAEPACPAPSTGHGWEPSCPLPRSRVDSAHPKPSPQRGTAPSRSGYSPAAPYGAHTSHAIHAARLGSSIRQVPNTGQHGAHTSLTMPRARLGPLWWLPMEPIHPSPCPGHGWDPSGGSLWSPYIPHHAQGTAGTPLVAPYGAHTSLTMPRARLGPLPPHVPPWLPMEPAPPSHSISHPNTPRQGRGHPRVPSQPRHPPPTPSSPSEPQGPPEVTPHLPLGCLRRPCPRSARGCPGCETPMPESRSPP